MLNVQIKWQIFIFINKQVTKNTKWKDYILKNTRYLRYALPKVKISHHKLSTEIGNIANVLHSKIGMFCGNFPPRKNLSSYAGVDRCTIKTLWKHFVKDGKLKMLKCSFLKFWKSIKIITIRSKMDTLFKSLIFECLKFNRVNFIWNTEKYRSVL